MTKICIKNLHVVRGHGAVLRDVSLVARSGECLGIVGESGSGKSTLLHTACGILTPASGTIEMITEDGTVLVPGKPGKHRERLQMVFQDPTASLDPRWPSWRIVTECLPPMTTHKAKEIAKKILDDVELGSSFAERLPGELSGGQKQRLGIARALGSEPSVLFLDEPVSALDVSVQAGILNLLKRLQRDRGLTYLFVSHDLAVVSHMAHRIVVLKSGCVVEEGETAHILATPQYPYTKSLVDAAASLR